MAEMTTTSKTNPLKIVASLVWILALAGVVWALTMEDRFFAVTGKPIAFLKTAKRSVSYRSEDDIKWRAVGQGQGFFDGDRLATGPDGTASIDFGEGRRGILGPDTIVSISSITQPSGKSFIVNLVKGAIKPVVPANAKNQLIVTSGMSTFFVEPGQARGFTKPVGGVIKEFSSREKFPVASKQPAAPVTPKYIVPATVSSNIASLPSVALPVAVPVVMPVQAEVGPKSVELADGKVQPALDPIEEAQPDKQDADTDDAMDDEAVPASTSQPIETPSPSPTPSAAPPVQAAVKATPTPKAPAKAKPGPVEKVVKQAPPVKIAIPEATVKMLMPAVDKTSVAEIYMSTAAMPSFTNESFGIKLQQAPKKMAGWRSGVQLEMGSHKTQFYSESVNLTVSFRPEQITSANRSSQGAIPCAVGYLRPLISTEMEGQTVHEIGQEPTKFQICSISDAKAKLPILVGLSRLDSQNADTKFFAPTGTAATYPYQIIVSRPDDLTKLLPYFSSTASFKIVSAGNAPDSGMYSVNQGKIGVQFVGATKPVQANDIMEALDHEFVFRGPRNAIQSVGGMNMDDFKAWVAKNSESGKTVYVRTKGGIVPVSADFINERPEVADFIKRAAGTVFLEKIDVVSFKTP